MGFNPEFLQRFPQMRPIIYGGFHGEKRRTKMKLAISFLSSKSLTAFNHHRLLAESQAVGSERPVVVAASDRQLQPIARELPDVPDR